MLKKIFTLVLSLLVHLSFAQNQLNSRLFYSKPKLHNSPTKVSNLNLSNYAVTVSLPIDNRSNFYGEEIYKNIKTHELQEFFESSTMTEIQNKINLDLKKFRANTNHKAQNKLEINPTVEIFYPKVHGFINGISLAKVRLQITTTLNGSLIVNRKYESLYITNGMDNGFEGDISMSIEEGENITVGMALRKALDDFYSDMNKILTLDKNKVIVWGTVTNAKTNAAVSVKISFKPDSLYSVTSSADGKFEIILPKRNYNTEIIAPNFLNYSEPLDVATSELKMVEKEFKLQPIEKGTVINLKNVLFYMGTINLLETSYDELDAVVAFLKNNRKVEIELHGHTDNQGDANKDLILSQQRVEKIKAYLISKGISSHRIKGEGFGGTQPIASNSTEDGRKLNRRVEFVILKK